MTFDMKTENGRIAVKLMAHTLVEKDIAAYGPIERSDGNLKARAHAHIARMQASLPTPQARLSNDSIAFTRLVESTYATIYKGLYVGYTVLSLPSDAPRYTTSVNLDDSEEEHEFMGFSGLLSLIKDAQDVRRKNAQEDGEEPEGYLLSGIQVTVYDAQEEGPDARRGYICYDLQGDRIIGACHQTDLDDDVLCGLGLPLVETVVSATKSGV